MNCFLRKINRLQSYTIKQNQTVNRSRCFLTGWIARPKMFVRVALNFFISRPSINSKNIWNKTREREKTVLSTEAEFHWSFGEKIYLFIYFSWYNCTYSINNARNHSSWSRFAVVFFVQAAFHVSPFPHSTLRICIIVICAFQINNDKIIINYFAIFV